MAGALLLLLAACGGGTEDSGPVPMPPPTAGPTPTPTPTPVPVPVTDVPAAAVGSYTARATEAAVRIVGASTPEQAVDATAQVLVDAGIRVYGGAAPAWAARAPAASWTIDRATVFNLAAEARDRAVSGRLTLAELGQMWADFGFPFAGSGMPGEQLLGYLRAAVVEGRAQPGELRNFVPLFVAAMAERQGTPADLANPATRPEDVRLTLLEIELLHALFDRAFSFTEPPAALSGSGTMRRLAGPDERVRAFAVSDGLCAELQKFYGTIGSKALEKGVEYAQGRLTESGLMALGMTRDEVALFGKYGKMFGALGSALKLVKLAQIYAAGQATLTVEGPNPVSKPAWNGPRRLVPVKATAGVPDAAWQEYQRNNGSEAYQSAKSCLGFLGAAIPLDIKDIAQQAGSWRVSWQLAGSPRHAVVPTDVNVFNASSSGNPFGMKLAQAGPSSAEATLKVDIVEESQLATLFQGPIVSAKVRVVAKVQTVEPPSPAVLAGIVSLAGTVGSLVDLGVGWIQAMIPPTTTTTITVEYHDEPQSFDASFLLSMTYDYPHLRGSPALDRHTISGQWAGSMTRRTLTQGGTEHAFFSGTGTFTYGSLTTAPRTDDDGCTRTSAWALRNGAFQMNLGPAVNAAGAVLPDGPEQINLGGGDVPVAQWPTEQRTLTVACPESDSETAALAAAPEIFVAAANAMNLQDALFMRPDSPPPGLLLTRGRLLADGTLELAYTSPRTVSVISPGAFTVDTTIVSQDSLIRLRPVYAPAAPR